MSIMTRGAYFWRLRHNLKLTKFTPQSCSYSEFKTKLYTKSALLNPENRLDSLIQKCAPRIIYNSVIERSMLNLERRQERDSSRIPPESLPPLSLKYVLDDLPSPTVVEETTDVPHTVDFPYGRGLTVAPSEEPQVAEPQTDIVDFAVEADRTVRERQKLDNMKNWMSAYENFDEDPVEVEEWRVNYGTPDPACPVSNVSCGGCGALLHCKNSSIPGYIPSEIYKNSFEVGGAALSALTCQRCHFLKHYNLALQVQVTPDDYPKILASISQRPGLVLLMVDLLDYPCSIWPGIGEIFGPKIPVVVVGNKVDLIPQDSEKFLLRIKNFLLESVKLEGFATFNIKDVVLISAKTGFGVEGLITRVQSLWSDWISGNVYIVGCTNVGKSSLFNALLQSDFCKIQAVDLVQRATTSVWPGTTLNLLKFPIKRPAGFRQYLRAKRLESLHKIEAEEKQLRKEQLRRTKDPKYATLVGHIGITRNPSQLVDESKDNFSLKSQRHEIGIREDRPEFALSKWCFDTPGVVQPDQIIHLLTTDELLVVLPKSLIVPRTFCLKPGSSLFVGGLARLDYLSEHGSVRLTVFASDQLPITVCDIMDSEWVYEQLLGSDLFKVPMAGEERLERWPGLEAGNRFTVMGEDWYKSAKDVVLSSAGWVSLTGRRGLKYEFQAWTPEKRGIFVRESLLPYAVGLAGKRIKHSVAYNRFRFYLK